jgi:hypothetical protein
MFLGFEGGATCHSPAAKEAQRPRPLIDAAGFRKLRFTLGVSCQMIVPLVVSSPTCLPNGKAGIMDSGLLHLEPIFTHNWTAYAVVAVGVLATFQKPEAAAC